MNKWVYKILEKFQDTSYGFAPLNLHWPEGFPSGEIFTCQQSTNKRPQFRSGKVFPSYLIENATELSESQKKSFLGSLKTLREHSTACFWHSICQMFVQNFMNDTSYYPTGYVHETENFALSISTEEELRGLKSFLLNSELIPKPIPVPCHVPFDWFYYLMMKKEDVESGRAKKWFGSYVTFKTLEDGETRQELRDSIDEQPFEHKPELEHMPLFKRGKEKENEWKEYRASLREHEDLSKPAASKKFNSQGIVEEQEAIDQAEEPSQESKDTQRKEDSNESKQTEDERNMNKEGPGKESSVEDSEKSTKDLNRGDPNREGNSGGEKILSSQVAIPAIVPQKKQKQKALNTDQEPSQKEASETEKEETSLSSHGVKKPTAKETKKKPPTKAKEKSKQLKKGKKKETKASDEMVGLLEDNKKAFDSDAKAALDDDFEMETKEDSEDQDTAGEDKDEEDDDGESTNKEKTKKTTKSTRKKKKRKADEVGQGHVSTRSSRRHMDTDPMLVSQGKFHVSTF